jgi:phosphoglycolate phosphatase-like HAD superfamily hydrolase
MAASRMLVLFDIDGTLVRRSGPHHRQALVDAVRSVTGLETTTDGVPVQGMLDPVILGQMLAGAGMSRRAVARAMPDLVREAQRCYLRNGPASLRDKVCPGVRPLLSKLARRGVPTGLVTGNLTRIAWRKMDRAGLKPYLRFGAFAEQAAERSGLVRIALRLARARGYADRGTRTWLIGDHPNDVAAAKSNGVGAVAVATGLASEAELREAGPDVLVEDLRALRWEALAG